MPLVTLVKIDIFYSQLANRVIEGFVRRDIARDHCKIRDRSRHG
jgi:hypothetical protein